MALFLSNLPPVFLLPLGMSLVMLPVGLVGLWWPGSRKRFVGFCVIVCLAIREFMGMVYYKIRGWI